MNDKKIPEILLFLLAVPIGAISVFVIIFAGVMYQNWLNDATSFSESESAIIDEKKQPDSVSTDTHEVANFALDDVTEERFIDKYIHNANQKNQESNFKNHRAVYLRTSPETDNNNNPVDGYEHHYYDIYVDNTEYPVILIDIMVNPDDLVCGCSIFPSSTSLQGISLGMKSDAYWQGSIIYGDILIWTINDFDWDSVGSLMKKCMASASPIHEGDYCYSYTLHQDQGQEFSIFSVLTPDHYNRKMGKKTDDLTVESTDHEITDSHALGNSEVPAAADLFHYLAKPEDEIRNVLGKSCGISGRGLLFDEGDVCIQVFENNVNLIELTGDTHYTILGFKPGDSADEFKSMLEKEYDAKQTHTSLGTNSKEMYFYVDGDVRIVNYSYTNGQIDSLSCEYDVFGTFEPPKDLTGANPFAFTEDEDYLESINLADQ